MIFLDDGNTAYFHTGFYNNAGTWTHEDGSADDYTHWGAAGERRSTVL